MTTLRQQILGFSLFLFACIAQAQSVWHCSRAIDLNSVGVDQAHDSARNEDVFQIASMSAHIGMIGVALRDIIDVYSGFSVRIGDKPLTACFNNDHSPTSKAALDSLGLNTHTMTALGRKSSIIRSQLMWVSNEGAMMHCIADNFPAVGYFPSIQETADIGPCF